MKTSKNPEEQLTYNKQVVDSLVAAFRTGLYPQGRKPLDQIVADGGKLGSYAAYTLIDAEFAMKNEEPGANILANQKKWMADLEKFIAKFPSADEVPAVLFHLATANEFNGDEDKARKQYGKLVKNYAATDAGKKAAGALRRLDLVGKSLVIKGTGLRNETVDSSQYRGKPVLVVFWATWATPAKDDLPRLKKLYDKYHGRGLEVIGVNLDNDRRELDAFLANNPARLAADLRAGRHGQPAGRRVRHHLAADDAALSTIRAKSSTAASGTRSSSSPSLTSCCRPRRPASPSIARTDRANSRRSGFSLTYGEGGSAWFASSHATPRRISP